MDAGVVASWGVPDHPRVAGVVRVGWSRVCRASQRLLAWFSITILLGMMLTPGSVRAQATTGSLSVGVSGMPSSVSVEANVTGPNNYQKLLTGLTDGSPQTLTGLTPGTYTVEGGLTAGYQPTVPSQTVQVSAGGTASDTIPYKGVPTTGTIDVTVTGLPSTSNDPVQIGGTGSNGGLGYTLNATQTLTQVPVGTWDVTVNPDTVGGIEYTGQASASTLTVSADSTASLKITYSAQATTGSLSVGTVTITPATKHVPYSSVHAATDTLTIQVKSTTNAPVTAQSLSVTVLQGGCAVGGGALKTNTQGSTTVTLDQPPQNLTHAVSCTLYASSETVQSSTITVLFEGPAVLSVIGTAQTPDPAIAGQPFTISVKFSWTGPQPVAPPVTLSLGSTSPATDVAGTVPLIACTLSPAGATIPAASTSYIIDYSCNASWTYSTEESLTSAVTSAYEGLAEHFAFESAGQIISKVAPVLAGKSVFQAWSANDVQSILSNVAVMAKTSLKSYQLMAWELAMAKQGVSTLMVQYSLSVARTPSTIQVLVFAPVNKWATMAEYVVAKKLDAGLSASLYGLAVANTLDCATVIGCLVPGVLTAAGALVGPLTNTWYLDSLADPSTDYGAVVQTAAVPSALAPLLRTAPTQVKTTVMDEFQYKADMEAAVESVARATGAAQAGATASERMQLAAAQRFGSEAAALLPGMLAGITALAATTSARSASVPGSGTPAMPASSQKLLTLLGVNQPSPSTLASLTSSTRSSISSELASFGHMAIPALIGNAEASYAQTPSGTPPFPDVSQSYWAYSYIHILSSRGIVSGFPGGDFEPNAPVTRAEFLKMLMLTLGLKPSTTPTPFTDVPAGAWYAPYVSAGVQAGIVDGSSPSTFSPNANLTREEMAVLLGRALHLTPTTTLHFTDTAQIDAWALQGVEEAVAAGYIEGFPNGTFQPLGTATRAQAAKILALVLAQQARGITNPASGG